MNINDAFPSHYLKASDLGLNEPIVTIRTVESEEVGRTKERKAVCYFAGKEKGLILNKTNAKKIAQLVGSQDTTHWAGRKIRLYATETEFGGETVECIRVKPAATSGGDVPVAPPPPPPPEEEKELTDDDIPF